MYKLITMLLCNHGDIRDVQAHLEHIKNTILTEVSVIIQDINHAKVIYYCVCVFMSMHTLCVVVTVKAIIFISNLTAKLK